MLGQMVVKKLSGLDPIVVEGTHLGDKSDPFFFNAAEDGKRLKEILKRSKYDYLINCIGILKPAINEGDSKSVIHAVQVNSIFPHELALCAEEVGSKVIHISTDGVFSGNAVHYFEDDSHDCPDVYGKTKSLGEVLAPGFLNIRCSIIGPDPIHRKGLLEWFLGQPDEKQIQGYIDYIWNGVTTLQFAELCTAIIVNDCFDEIWNESRVHHLCPNLPVSKFDLLTIFKSAFKKDIEILPKSGEKPPVNRVLKTHYKSLPHLMGSNIPMETSIAKLASWMSTS